MKVSNTAKKECIAMVLADDQDSRLATLTTQIPKSALPFGGNYRLIDFSLSNCYNSRIDTIGVLTSKQPFELNKHSLVAQGLPRDRCNIHTLPPTPVNELPSYTGTANALYENIDFIDQFAPEYVLVLSGDHVYKMDYTLLLEYHKGTVAAATVSVIEVPYSKAARFGSIATQADGSVVHFTGTPTQPLSNLTSMGVYIFSWPKLKYYLALDQANPLSNHDLAKNIIPAMLNQGEKICAYHFNSYWKEIGTVKNLYEAHMDLLLIPPLFDIQDRKWPLYSTLTDLPSPVSVVNSKKKSIISKNSFILGEIEKSIIFPGTYIGNKAKIKNSIIMPGAFIGHGAYVERAIIGPGAAVENGCYVLGGITQPIAVIGQNTVASAKRQRFDVIQAMKLG